MNQYTVLLLHPDYVANPYGTDTYMTTVIAPDVNAAELEAQKSALYADDLDEKAGAYSNDYVVLAVIAGDHQDIKTI